jgi:hypothetical protein
MNRRGIIMDERGTMKDCGWRTRKSGEELRVKVDG